MLAADIEHSKAPVMVLIYQPVALSILLIIFSISNYLRDTESTIEMMVPLPVVLLVTVWDLFFYKMAGLVIFELVLILWVCGFVYYDYYKINQKNTPVD
jgi:hypothetical protein